MKARSLLLMSICLWVPVSLATAELQSSVANLKGCNGRISILGTTNVNNFELTNQLNQIVLMKCAHAKDTLALQSKKFWLQIPAKSFKSSNHQICRDFLSMIRADQHPSISVGILLRDLHRLIGHKGILSFPVEVSIAGKNSSYTVKCIVSECNDHCFLVTGSKEMKLTDFGITPPQKYFGLIRVDNEILVNFDFAVSIQ